MSIISDIKAFDSKGLFVLAAIFVELIVPGFLTLYTFDRELFLRADILKISILAASITAPTFVLLFTTTLIGERVFTGLAPKTVGRFGGFKDWAVTHSLSNATIFFIPLLIHLATGLSTGWFAAWVIGLFTVYVAFEHFRLLLLAKGKTDARFQDPGSTS
jgi:acyl-CoA synthetase (AMP-forming)/AMP-acid ligase II